MCELVRWVACMELVWTCSLGKTSEKARRSVGLRMLRLGQRRLGYGAR